MFYYVFIDIIEILCFTMFIGGDEYMNKIVGYRKMLGMTQEKWQKNLIFQYKPIE